MGEVTGQYSAILFFMICLARSHLRIEIVVARKEQPSRRNLLRIFSTTGLSTSSGKFCLKNYFSSVENPLQLLLNIVNNPVYSFLSKLHLLYLFSQMTDTFCTKY